MPDAPAKLLVIDVMPLLYRGHFALMRRPRLTSSGFNSSALFVFTNIVREMLADRGATHAALVMDASPTFRHERYPDYKAQREKLPEDIAASLGPAEDFARALRVPFLRVPGFEADDLMGTLAARAEAAGFTTWIVTPDKDMAQLVTPRTFLCRPSHVPGERDDLYDEARVCAEWGLREPAQMVDLLGMAGDASDNIPGFPGVGPKTAASLLGKYGSVEEVIAHAAEIPGKTGRAIAEHAEQGRLSRWLAQIRRDVPVDATLDDLRISEPDRPALEAFCRRFELNTLLHRFYPDAPAGPAGQAPSESPDGQAPSESPDGRAPSESPDGRAPSESPDGRAPSESPDGRAPSRPDEGPEAAEPPAPLATTATTPHDYRLVVTEADLAALRAELEASAEFAFDTETDGLDPRTARAVGLSFCTLPGRAWYVPLPAPPPPPAEPADLFSFAGISDNDAPPGTPASGTAADGRPLLSADRVRAALGPVFADPAVAKCGHNLKFDLHVLRNLGIEVAGRLSDSMLAHYVVDPAQRHGMDPLAREFLRYDPIPIETLIGPRGKTQTTMDKVDVARACEYAAEDADVTLRLHRVLEPVVREKGAWRAYDEAENPLVPVLLDMESAGVRVDAAALARYGETLGAEIAQTVRRVQDLAGEPFNLDSPQQLGRILFDRLGLPSAAKTSQGRHSTAEDVLVGLAAEHPIVPLILEYRACSKLKSTYVDKLPQCIDPRDGRVHTTFNQALTETGRLSSDNPNLQNVPVRTERGRPVRAAFLAADDAHRLVSADYSQIELRMAAAMSGDEAMIEAFRNDADIHRETAARVYGIPPDEVTRDQRAHCKQVSFGILYGISPFGLAQRLGISRQAADGLIRAYFETYPGVRRFLDETVERARRDGFVSTLLGRRRPLRDIASRNATVRAAAERNAVNTPVQGSAADLIKLAMVRVHAALVARRLRSRLVLQIHDELLLDCPETEVDEVSALVREAMEGALDLAVPLKVDVGVGANWLEAH